LAKDQNKGKQIAYTHGATVEDIERDPDFSAAAKKRGLTQAEVKEIIAMGGIMGLSVTRPFFQGIDKIAERIDQICQVDNGIQRIGLGTDFGGVAPIWEVGIGKPEDVAKLGDVLADRFGYSDAEIKSILRDNVDDWLKHTL